MTSRTTVRTVVTLVTALCVVTMFAGSAAALINVDTDEEQESDGLVNIDTGLDSDASQSGGSGGGGLAVDTEQGGIAGVGTVEVDAENQNATIDLDAEGGPAGEKQSVGLECTLGADEVQNPQENCGPTGDIAPDEGENPLPVGPGDIAPDEGENPLPVGPGDIAPDEGENPLPLDKLQFN